MSAIFPEGGPPRLFRFVEPNTLDSPIWVAQLIKDDNVLLIDRVLYEMHDPTSQHILLRTSRPFVEFHPLQLEKAS